MRHQFFSELMQKNLFFYTEQKSGSLSYQLSNDIWQVAYSLTNEGSSILRGSAFFGGGLGFLLYSSPSLTALAFCPIAFFVLLSRYYGRLLKLEREQQAELLRSMIAHAQERLRQMKTVKLFNAESIELSTFSDKQTVLYEKSLEVAKYTAQHMSLIEVLGQTSVISCLGFGGYLITLSSGLNLGALTAFALYSVYTGLGFRMIVGGYTEIKKSSGIYNKIDGILKDSSNRETVRVLLPSKEPSKEPNKEPNNTASSVTFEKVTFEYPDRNTIVLEDVSFHINPGEVWGLVGCSGSGKSTIFHLTAKLFKPTSGEIYIGGTAIASQPEWWVREHISTVSQEALLYSGSLLENIRYSNPTASLAEVVETCKRADAFGFISEMPNGLDTQVGELGYRLSGGQRQRVCIARALLKRPQILLLDEATSGVDTHSEFAIQKIIEREVKRGYTAMVITHRIASLKHVADKILFLHEGKVARICSFEELMEDPLFRSLYKI